jgi:hypothetical protein
VFGQAEPAICFSSRPRQRERRNAADSSWDGRPRASPHCLTSEVRPGLDGVFSVLTDFTFLKKKAMSVA